MRRWSHSDAEKDNGHVHGSMAGQATIHHHHKYNRQWHSSHNLHHVHHHHHPRHHHHHQSFDQEDPDEKIAAFWTAIAASTASVLCLVAYSTYQSVLQPLLVPAMMGILASMVLHPVKTALVGCFEAGCKYVSSKRCSLKKIVKDHCGEMVKAYKLAMEFSFVIGLATTCHLAISGRLRRDFEKAWKVHIQPKPLEIRLAMGTAVIGLIVLARIVILKREQMLTEGTLKRQKSRRRKTSKESKQSEKPSLVPQIPSPAGLRGLICRLMTGLRATLAYYLQLVDRALKAAVLGALSRVASWVGLKSKMPAPMLAFLKEKSPSRKEDVLAVPRTFSHSKYRKHRRDSERRCSLPTISEDEAGRADASTKRLQSKFPRSTDDLRFRAIANSLQQNRRLVDQGSHPAMTTFQHSCNFPREGSPYPPSSSAPFTRRPVLQRSLSNPSEEDEGYDEDCCQMEVNKCSMPPDPNHGVLVGLVPSILGLPLPPVPVGPWCCQMNPVFKPRFGNFLTPPDILASLVPMAPLETEDLSYLVRNDVDVAINPYIEEVLIRSRANSDCGPRFRNDSTSSQDSYDSTEDLTQSTMTIDEDEEWSEALPPPDQEQSFTTHWLVGIIWYRILCMERIGDAMIALPALGLLITSIQKMRLVNFDILEEHLDLLYYHWCVKWRERRHLMLPRPLLAILGGLRTGYTSIWQIFKESVDALAAAFTIILIGTVGIILHLWAKNIIVEEVAATKQLAGDVFLPLLAKLQNCTGVVEMSHQPLPDANISSEEWMETQDLFLSMLEEQLQNMLNTSNNLVTSAVATALSTGNVLLSNAIGTDASIIPEPQVLEASNMTNIWANLHAEEDFGKSAAIGQLLAWAVQYSLELWIICTMIYQLLKQRRNEVWCLIAALFDWLAEMRDLAFPGALDSSFIALQDILGSIFSVKTLQQALFIGLWMWTVLENAGTKFQLLTSVVAALLVVIPLAPAPLAILPSAAALWMDEAFLPLALLSAASLIGASHSSISASMASGTSSSWRSKAEKLVSLFGASLALACILISSSPPGIQKVTPS